MERAVVAVSRDGSVVVIENLRRYPVDLVSNTARCALWLSGSVYRAKSCTIVFLAGNFLFVISDTFAVVCIV